MNDEVQSPIDTNRASQTEGITIDQLSEYVHAKKCMGPCPACGSEDWVFPEYEEKPELLLMPSVRDARMADWLFQMCCDNCGVQRFIGAAYVWAYFYGDGATNNG